MTVAFFAILSYLYGSIPFGYIAAFLLKGEKLTHKGTGNVGVTNAFKVGGMSVGIITVAGEISKATIPVYTAQWMYPDNLFAALLFVFSALAGTCFSVFLKGRGGKGSTLAAWSLLLLSPYAGLVLIVTAGVLSLLARMTMQIKKLQLLLIPGVIHVVEGNLLFTCFGVLTSFLFAYNLYFRKDDFGYYRILGQKIGDTSISTIKK